MTDYAKRHEDILCTLHSAFSESEQSKCDPYLRDQRLQQPLHGQSADLQALRVPFQQDGRCSASHDDCENEEQEGDSY